MTPPASKTSISPVRASSSRPVNRRPQRTKVFIACLPPCRRQHSLAAAAATSRPSCYCENLADGGTGEGHEDRAHRELHSRHRQFERPAVLPGRERGRAL